VKPALTTLNTLGSYNSKNQAHCRKRSSMSQKSCQKVPQRGNWEQHPTIHAYGHTIFN